MVSHLLILGGTAEAAELAGRAVAALSPAVEVISSLAGRLKPHHPIPGTVRVGGFGGAHGLEEYLRRQNIDALIDATHPFAATISAHARKACKNAAVPRLTLRRPPWRAVAGDNWTQVETLAAAAARLPAGAERVFLTTGVTGLDAFGGVDGIHFVVRLIQAPAQTLPLARCTLITGRPPYEAESEQALMAEHRIDCLITKQSGGDATAGKLTAARHLGLPVIMIARPEAEPGERVETVAEALGWAQEKF